MSVGSNQTDLQVETMYARDLELLSVEEKSVCSTDVNHTYNEAENEEQESLFNDSPIRFLYGADTPG